MHFKKIVFLMIILIFPFKSLKALECDNKYLIETIASLGKTEYIGCTDNYEEAKKLMREYDSTKRNVAVIYEDGVLVNARYAVVNFTGRSDLITIYDNENLSGTRYAYIHGDWGADGAFLDYNPVKKTIKVKISGLVGWTKATNVDIIPLANLDSKSITILTTVRVRTTPKYLTDNSNQYTSVSAGTIWNYIDTVEADGFLWYKINYKGEYYYIAGKNLKEGTIFASENSSYTFKTYYKVNNSNDLVHYYRTLYNQTAIDLGVAPKSIEKNTTYYSFDGNYFYLSLEKMLDDYYNNTYDNAYNRENPYFNYYMYLPVHSLTGYTALDFDQVIINRGYNKAPDPNVIYYTLEDGWTSAPRTGVSALYETGKYFIQSQTEYGVNALLTFGTAINESGTGTSALALFKNNLFGHNAYDSCPISCATKYDTILDSIMAHAAKTDSSYSKPTNSYYYGSFYGNKGSGFGVNYASDPYWGEKTARLAYQNDLNFGGQDFNSNTLGIKLSNEAFPIKKSPSDDAKTIYLLKNNRYNHLVTNMSFIVTEKVYDAEGNAWYKIYTDSALDKDQNLVDANYKFEQSYGYIRAEYLYVENSAPVINATDTSIYRGEAFDALKHATATDLEAGDLTSSVTYEGTVDQNVVGEYYITYKVTDNQRFTVTKTIKVTVLPSTAPTIEAKDIEIKQYKAFDPKTYVKVIDNYGVEIKEFEVIENTINIKIPGIYKVTYKVTHDKYQVTKTIKVVVLKDEVPVINVSNRTIKVNEKFDLRDGVSAIDQEDGDLTSKIAYEGIVDVKKPGKYQITYRVKDSANQEATKTITITVEDIDYIKKDGDFYFNELNYVDGKLSISGYLAIKGMSNRKGDEISYDLIIRNNDTNEDIVFPLERWLVGAPERHYSDSKYEYSATWFKGNIKLDTLKHGEYTLYVRARLKNYETINLFRNVFAKQMVTKVSDQSRGYLFRNNNYLDDYPIELFVYENDLISNVVNNNQSNMINNYKSLTIKDNKLEIMGVSYNIGTDYSEKVDVSRNIILENIETHKRFTYNVGSFVGSDIELNVSDGFSRKKAWFNASINLNDIPTGDYIIYVQTIAGKTNDFGELNDIFLKKLDQLTTKVNGKTISLSLNIAKRFRIELHVK